MLEHKQVPYRRVDNPHAPAPACGPGAWVRRRRPETHRRRTAPASAAHGRSTRHGAGARRQRRADLDQSRDRALPGRSPPRARLFPADPKQRSAVEDAERWANEKLQMAARRILSGTVLGDPAAFSRKATDGPVGVSPLSAGARAAPDHSDDRPPCLCRRPGGGARAPTRAPRDARPNRRLDRRRSSRRSPAERSGLHGRAQPGVDPLPVRRPAPYSKAARPSTWSTGFCPRPA